MRDVAAFAGLAQSVAFDGLGEDHGGRAGVLDRALIGVVDLQGIVAAAAQRENFFVAHVLHQLQQLWIFAEKFFAHVGAVLGFETLILAVQASPMRLIRRPVVSRASSGVPIAAPQNLDDVPAGAAERGFEFRDDLAVAADRSIQALEVAVDDEDEVVQLFARGQRDGAQRLGFVGLAVAQEGPDLARRWRE